LVILAFIGVVVDFPGQYGAVFSAYLTDAGAYLVTAEEFGAIFLVVIQVVNRFRGGVFNIRRFAFDNGGGQTVDKEGDIRDRIRFFTLEAHPVDHQEVVIIYIIIIDKMDAFVLFFALFGMFNRGSRPLEEAVDFFIGSHKRVGLRVGYFADGGFEVIVIHPGVDAFQGRPQAINQNHVGNGVAFVVMF